MRIAYLDCFSGISGNMVLGALVDLGLDLEKARAELGKLPLSGYGIEVSKVTKRGIRATYLDVVTAHPDTPRMLKDIISLIDRSRLDEGLKRHGREVFVRLAEAEARVHDLDMEAVHLHEVGAIDTLVDVFGTLIGMKVLGIEEVRCSPLNLGSGLAQCSHGWLPVPAPITVELLRGVPAYTGEAKGELTTPTGAAIATGIAAGFGDMPLMRVEGVGYGAGKMDPEVPNLLRILVGERVGTASALSTERVTVIETNIDDMNPQFYDHIMEGLLRAGALDVFLTPVQMKKNRPGVLLSAIGRSESTQSIVDVMVRESTTLGVRISETLRVSLPRSAGLVDTRFGQIRIKVARRDDGSSTMKPEYDDCKKAAREHNVSLGSVYSEVQKAWGESGGTGTL
ncbi:MAG: nickel pincer cofactor biosynthesis protein LarC [Dehalococcoidia bacterium]|nr:nickel pincer cofactor biosynthesis protein LarC [Dehalococcoidia bacterium]